jgi:hypothetical protein
MAKSIFFMEDRFTFLNEFLRLSNCGIDRRAHLMTYFDETHIVNLFYEAGEFIEVRFDVRRGGDNSVTRFRNPEVLDDYLEFIDLDLLIAY